MKHGVQGLLLSCMSDLHLHACACPDGQQLFTADGDVWMRSCLAAAAAADGYFLACGYDLVLPPCICRLTACLLMMMTLRWTKKHEMQARSKLR